MTSLHNFLSNLNIFGLLDVLVVKYVIQSYSLLISRSISLYLTLKIFYYRLLSFKWNYGIHPISMSLKNENGVPSWNEKWMVVTLFLYASSSWSTLICDIHDLISSCIYKIYSLLSCYKTLIQKLSVKFQKQINI